MGYFIYTPSEEALREQYRKLLIKYDYRSGKNQKTIDEITKEYQKLVAQAKYDNGYRTPLQKVQETAKGIIDVSEARYAAEAAKDEADRERIRQKQQRQYTKQDFQGYMTQMQRCVDGKVREIVYGEKYNTYKIFIETEQNSAEIYQRITRAYQKDKEFEEHRLNLEYCTLYFAGNNRKKAELLLDKIDAQLGESAKKSFYKYERLMDDPVKEMEGINLANQVKKASDPKRIGNKIDKILSLGNVSTAVAIFIAAMFASYSSIDASQGESRLPSLIFFAVCIIIIFGIRRLCKAIWKRISKLDSVRFTTERLRESEYKKKKNRDRTVVGFTRLFIRLIQKSLGG